MRITCLALALLVGCGSADDNTSTPAVDASGSGDTAADGGEHDTSAPDDTAEAPDDTSPEADVAEPEPDVPSEEVSDDTEAPDVVVPWTPAVYAYPACDASTPAGIAGCVDKDRLEKNLIAIVGSRYPGEPNHTEARDLCRSTFTAAGFTVSESHSLLGGNIIGTREGVGAPDELVVVGAHIDGRQNCDSADGNATGVAALMELATAIPAGHRRTLVVACWDEGELGRAGAIEHADDLLVSGAHVAVVIGLDSIGFTDDTPMSQQAPITTANFPEAKAKLAAAEYRGVQLALIGGKDASSTLGALASGADGVGLPTITYSLEMEWLTDQTFSDFQRSNHVVFWTRGFRAVTATDTGSQRNPQHRCRQGGKDSLERLDLDFFRASTAATLSGVRAVLEADDGPIAASPLHPACDVGAQDCGEGKRCVHLRNADGTEARTCIPVDPAAVPAGGVCTRPNETAGEDTCAPGLFCSFYGGTAVPNSDPAEYERVCSRYCRHPKDCGEGELCVGIDFGVERTGLCRPRCTLLAEGNCPAQQKCSLVGLTTGTSQGAVCMPAGSAALGESCTDSNGCGEGATCLPTAGGADHVCRPACTDSLPCPEALQCYNLGGGFVFMLLDDPTYGVCADPGL